MGFYRLFLSFLVIASHMNLQICHYNLGVLAVISFYILSGYVMTALLQAYYGAAADIPAFYLDRVIRIGPQFYFYSFATLAALLLFNMHHGWMLEPPDFVRGLAQFALLPLNFYSYFPSMFLPQAWSLGLEAMFYMIFPFIILFKIRLPVALLSGAIFILAIGGWINTELYAYRYLPGVLFIFICGSWLYHADHPWQKAMLYGIALCAFAALGYSYVVKEIGDTAYSRPILLGLGFGILVVAVACKAFKQSKKNMIAGDLSYGVFLSHNFLIGMMETISPWRVHADGIFLPVNVFLVCLLACCASYISFSLFEAPLIAWRQRLRSANTKKKCPVGHFPSIALPPAA